MRNQTPMEEEETPVQKTAKEESKKEVMIVTTEQIIIGNLNSIMEEIISLKKKIDDLRELALKESQS